MERKNNQVKKLKTGKKEKTTTQCYKFQCEDDVEVLKILCGNANCPIKSFKLLGTFLSWIIKSSPPKTNLNITAQSSIAPH